MTWKKQSRIKIVNLWRFPARFYRLAPTKIYFLLFWLVECLPSFYYRVCIILSNGWKKNFPNIYTVQYNGGKIAGPIVGQTFFFSWEILNGQFNGETLFRYWHLEICEHCIKIDAIVPKVCAHTRTLVFNAKFELSLFF